ncbi:class I SAM-dependent methyltransferase [Ideonella sp. A 288]|uniref:class I SAM-dependent methyltransferase n=1 Tax=Ideonella sp. A 288 TaxID=1962181 RepID=UPI000B4A5F21|nr:class I SAM-dependent methyltransferase [Ideonella sp. A 288]
MTDDFECLAAWVDLRGARVIELGCGAAALARRLVASVPGCTVTALEVDERQLALNQRTPAGGLRFVQAGAQAIPFADAGFDLALMLKSLHHVPMPLMDQALAEARRVLRQGGHLYVSEPVFDGALNEVIRLFNDEGEVRAAAQAAVDRALAGGGWLGAGEVRFDTAVRFADGADFERRMIDVTFADRHLDAAQRRAVRDRFEPHIGTDGAHFVRPMHVRLLRAA